MTTDNEAIHGVLVEVVKVLDEIRAKVSLIHARNVRIETRVSKIAMRLGLTHEGEAINTEPPDIKVVFTPLRPTVEPMSVHP